MPSLALALGAVLLAAAPALARTDLTGCTYYDSVVAPSHQAPYATRIWYVPDTGELCAFLDCGGGRAPPKTTVPGCPLYDGTATYSPSFIDPKTLGRAGAPATATTTTTAAAARTASAATTTEGRTTAAPSVAGTASGSGAESTTGGASAATEPAESSGSSRSGASPASPSSSTAGGDRAATTTGTSTTPTGAAAGLPTAAAAVLGPCLLAGVAAGMGLL